MKSTVGITILGCALLAACVQGVPMRASGWTSTANATQPVDQVFAECLAEAQTARLVLGPASAAADGSGSAATGEQLSQQDVINSCMRVRGFVPAQAGTTATT